MSFISRLPSLRAAFRALLGACAGAFFCTLLLAGWLVASESGGHFLANHAAQLSGDMLRVQGWQGRLLDHGQAGQIQIHLPGLEIEAHGVSIDWQPLKLRQRALEVDALSLQRLEIRSAPSGTPVKLPGDLSLPLALHIRQLRIDTLLYGTLASSGKQPAPDLDLRQIRADVQSSGGEHIVRGLALQAPVGSVTGDLRLAARAPFDLSVQLKLLGAVQDYRATIQADLQGTLAEIKARLDASSSMQGLSSLKGHADLVLLPFAALPLKQARLNLEGLDPAAFHPAAPHALLDAQADLVPRLRSADKTAPADWYLSGPIRLRNRDIKLIEAHGLPLETLQAHIDWAAGRLQLNELELALPGKGRVTGLLGWLPDQGNGLGQLEAVLHLQDVDPAKLSSRARSMQISGDIKAQGGEQAQSFSLDVAAAKMHLKAEGEQRAGVLRLTRAALQAFDAQATLSGSLDLKGSRAFALQGQVERLDPHVFLKDVPQAALSASFSTAGSLEPMPVAAFSLVLSPSRFAGYPLDGHAKGRFAPGRLLDADVNLAVMGNEVHLTGAVGAPADVLKFAIDAPHLERFGADYGGSLRADGNVSGGFESPFGSVSADARQLRAPGGWMLAEAKLRASLQAGEAGEAEVRAEFRDLAQTRDGEAKTWLKSLNMDLAGKRADHSVRMDASFPGDFSAKLSAAGGVKGVDWQGLLLGLGVDGPMRFVLEKPAALAISPQRIALGEARLISLLREQGRIELQQTEWTPEHLLAKGKVSGVELGFSLDEYQRTVFRGRSLQLGAEWDLALAEHPKGLVRIFREGGDFVMQGDAPVALGLEHLDINAAIDEGRLAVSALVNGSRIGAFNAVATMALQGHGANTRIDMNAPLVGVLNADMPSISWLGSLADQNLRTSGSLQGQFNLTGTPQTPVGAGFVKGEGLGLALAEQGLRLDQGQLLINFDAARVSLDKLIFRSDNRMALPDGRLPKQAAEGSLQGRGEIALPTGKGHFQLKLDHVAGLQQPGQWMLLSGEASIDSGWDQLDINARLRSDAGYIGVPRGSAPRLSDDVVIRGRQKPPQRLKLNADIAFDFGDSFILKAYGIDTWLAGQLRIRLAQGMVPRATGSIQARDGIFNAYGQRLEIERGAVNFHGALDDPALNVIALRKGLEVEAGVEVTGSAQRPKVRLVSEPNVPEQEKLAWILFGRPSEGSAADIGVLLSAAGANLGGDGEGIGARIASGFGLDNVGIASSSNGQRRGLQSSVANNATSGNATPGATSSSAGETMNNQVLSLSKRLSSRAYLSFEQNFLGTESVVKLSYALTRFVSVIARGGTDNALDLNYSVSFR